MDIGLSNRCNENEGADEGVIGSAPFGKLGDVPLTSFWWITFHLYFTVLDTRSDEDVQRTRSLRTEEFVHTVSRVASLDMERESADDLIAVD